MRVKTTAGVALIGGVALALLSGLTATAAEAATLPPKPPGSYGYTIPITALGTAPLYPGSGGWWVPASGETLSGTRLGGGACTKTPSNCTHGGGGLGVDPSRNVFNQVFRLSEPYVSAGVVTVQIEERHLTDNRGSFAGNPIVLNTRSTAFSAPFSSGSNTDNGGYCSASTGWVASSTFTRSTQGQQSTATVQGWASTNGAVNAGTSTGQVQFMVATQCPNVSRLVVDVAYGVGGGEQRIRSFFWDADRWTKGDVPYTNKGAEEALCNSENASVLPDCLWYQGTADGTDFSTVCRNAPPLLWNDWSTLGDWVGHYGRCLFVPVNGFDQANELGSAWTDSSGGTMTGALDALWDSWYIPESCGQLFNLSTTAIPGVNLNSCNWAAEWAPAHLMLSILVRVLSGVALIVFLVKTIIGVINKKTPVPFDEADS